MKIVIDARRIRQSTARYSRNLIDQLQKIDTDNEYVVFIHKQDVGHWRPKAKNFKLKVVGADHYTFAEQLVLPWQIYAQKADLVHFTMPQQPFIYFRKKVTTIHDLTLVKYKNLDKNRWIYAIEQAIFKLLIHWVCRTSKKIITGSDYVRKDVIDYTKIQPIKVVRTYEAADEIKQHKPEVIDQLKSKKYVSYVGNAFPYKNLHRLIDAFKTVQKDYPDTVLALAGKTDFFYKKAQKYASDQGVDAVFLGFISDSQLVWLYQHSLLHVFPSLSEGFGLPGLEAMQYKVALASSSATCLPEIFESAAEYFDPTSTQEISKVIKTLLSDEGRKNELIELGSRQVNKFSWRKMANSTWEIYQEVL